MEFLISAKTDVGTSRGVNQDRVLIKTAATEQGTVVLAAICDGMGGLDDGGTASATVTAAVERWFAERLGSWIGAGMQEAALREEWTALADGMNRSLLDYGREKGLRLGTTMTVLLLFSDRYFIIHVGDTRVYAIGDSVVQLTDDHTVAAREVREGKLDPAEVEQSHSNHILTNCIGAKSAVDPAFYVGRTRADCVYLLCSDGFRHKLRPQELQETLGPEQATSGDALARGCETLIALAKARGERDNISVAVIRPFFRAGSAARIVPGFVPTEAADGDTIRS